MAFGGDEVACRAEQPVAVLRAPDPEAGQPGTLQKLCAADGVDRVRTRLPQVRRPGQQVGGLARRAELLGEVGALEERRERRGAFAGLLVVRCEVAQPAQLVDPSVETVSR